MSDERVLELAAFARCFHPQDPMPGLFQPGPSLILTEAGHVVSEKLRVLATEAIGGPAGFGPYRPALFLAQRAFASREGEAVAAAAEILGNVAEGLLAPPEPAVVDAGAA